MLLKISNLSKNFGGVQAVQNLTMKAKEGEITSVIGPNGAGKTTTFNLISGIYIGDTGDIFFKGESIFKKPQEEIAKKGISRTFQNIRLFSGLTVLENVMTALDSSTPYSMFSAMLGLPKKVKYEKANKEIAYQVLEQLDILQYAEEKPQNLAYGLQRRVELARAIICKPDLLMLDEPAAGLNPSEVEEFIQLIQELKEKNNFSILLIEHRMKVINRLSDYVYVLNFGQLLAEGSVSDVIKNHEVIEAYLGQEEA